MATRSADRRLAGRGADGAGGWLASACRLILNVRLERVKQLLTETNLSLPDIADRTGFNHSEYLSMVFKQRTGQTVTAFRKVRPGRP